MKTADVRALYLQALWGQYQRIICLGADHKNVALWAAYLFDQEPVGFQKLLFIDSKVRRANLEPLGDLVKVEHVPIGDTDLYVERMDRLWQGTFDNNHIDMLIVDGWHPTSWIRTLMEYVREGGRIITHGMRQEALPDFEETELPVFDMRTSFLQTVKGGK